MDGNVNSACFVIAFSIVVAKLGTKNVAKVDLKFITKILVNISRASTYLKLDKVQPIFHSMYRMCSTTQ